MELWQVILEFLFSLQVLKVSAYMMVVSVIADRGEELSLFVHHNLE